MPQTGRSSYASPHAHAFTVSLLFVCAATLTLAALAGPAKCYDWITRDKIRGGYMSVGRPRPADAADEGGRHEPAHAQVRRALQPADRGR